MKSTLLKSMLVVSVAVLAVASFAQGGGGGRGQGGGRGFGQFGRGAQDSTGTFLLQRTDVQGELKITDDQKSKIQAQQEGMRDKFREAMQNANGDQEAMRASMTKLMTESSKATLAILTDDQKKRLHELAIQRMGNSAALAPDVQKDLGITDDQKTKLKDLQDKQNTANQSLFEKIRNQEMTREEFQDAQKKNTEIFNTEVGKILTDAQKTKLKDMGGKPFTFKDEPRTGGGL